MGGGSDAALSGDQQWVTRLTAASRVAAAVLVALGCTVLCGWLFRWQVLISLSPQYAPMKPNTALGFLLAGAALWSLHAQAEGTRRSGRWLSRSVLLLGSLTLSEYIV